MTDLPSFEVMVKWQEDRMGLLSSAALTDTITVATPPGFKNGIAGLWSPEHLFVASVCSCYMATFLAVAENSKLEYRGFKCKANGLLEQESGKIRVSVISLHPAIVVSDDKQIVKGIKVLEKTKQHCIIANSINCRVVIIPEVNVPHKI